MGKRVSRRGFQRSAALSWQNRQCPGSSAGPAVSRSPSAGVAAEGSGAEPQNPPGRTSPLRSPSPPVTECHPASYTMAPSAASINTCRESYATSSPGNPFQEEQRAQAAPPPCPEPARSQDGRARAEGRGGRSGRSRENRVSSRAAGAARGFCSREAGGEGRARERERGNARPSLRQRRPRVTASDRQ